MNAFQITSFNYDGIPLDLSGKRDAEDCWIERVCVAGTQHNVIDMLDDTVIGRLVELADAQLAREAAAIRADVLYDSRRLAYELDRLMRQ